MGTIPYNPRTLGFVREAQWALNTRSQLSLAKSTAYTSVICHGEILALSEKLGWGGKKRSKLDVILSKIPTLDINKEGVINAYARIDTWTHGSRLARLAPRPPPKPAIPMKQNDLWIVATAHASKATLVSTDKDFQHLKDVWLQFAYIDQRV